MEVEMAMIFQNINLIPQQIGLQVEAHLVSLLLILEELIIM
jgi:hypothetical protein